MRAIESYLYLPVSLKDLQNPSRSRSLLADPGMIAGLVSHGNLGCCRESSPVVLRVRTEQTTLLLRTRKLNNVTNRSTFYSKWIFAVMVHLDPSLIMFLSVGMFWLSDSECPRLAAAAPS